MKIILVFVSTLDGKVTRWGDPDVKSWSSKYDQKYFRKIWDYSELIVMGSTTYNVDPIKPSKKHLLVVMTREPEKYEKYEVAGTLEFKKESPVELFSDFEKRGYEAMVVVGGPHIATSFLKEGLVDELWLTIEPKIFGKGDSIVTTKRLDISLQLISCEKVNEQGTLITKYLVLKR